VITPSFMVTMQQAILPNLRNFGGSLGGVPYPVDLGFMG
jgi:hypothetical protein